MPAISFLTTYPLVRTLIGEISRVEGAEGIVEEIAKGIIKWAEDEERTFLRLNLQTTLGGLLFRGKKVGFIVLQ